MHGPPADFSDFYSLLKCFEHNIDRIMAPERSKKGKKKTVKKDGGNTREYTPEMLIEQGNVALGNMQLELAAEFFNRALNLSPEDTNIMDALADVMIQLGEQEKALELLLRSTQSAPTVNPYKWFFLGQLQLEFDAVKCYRTGIQILMSIINSEGDAEVQATTTKQVAKAYCSIAEIYLTDLCFEEDAEKVCEEAVAAALQICPGSLDAMQTLASIRLSQQRKSEAGDIIIKVYSELMRIREIVSARTVVQEMCGAEEPAELRDAPELSFCVATVKLLIECAGDAAHGALYTMALELGEGLLLEDDENIELWYLMGVACMGNFDTCAATQQQKSKATEKQEKAGEEEEADLAAAQYHFETALQLMDKLKEEARREGMVDGQFIYQDQYGLVQEHLRIIAAATGEGSARGSGMAVQAVPADEEWSDGEEGGMAVDEAS